MRPLGYIECKRERVKGEEGGGRERESARTCVDGELQRMKIFEALC